MKTKLQEAEFNINNVKSNVLYNNILFQHIYHKDELSCESFVSKTYGFALKYYL